MALLRPVIRDRVLNAPATGRSRENSPRVAIGELPDEILLKIFDFCRLAAVSYGFPRLWRRIWHKLVHVCQRWRYVLLSSPLSLDLQLHCTIDTAVKEMLDVWPSIPIQIISSNIEDNVMAALGHHDRIREIILHVTDSEYKRLATVVQKSFPVLTTFHLSTYMYEHAPVLPDTFLGGSAPCLRSLRLDGLTFPTLPQFLLSCNDLSDLELLQMSDIGYNSPEEMAIGLSTLTKLTHLNIEFGQSRGTTRCPPPLTRVLLPALTQFEFRGSNEYLEDLLAQIDAPQLEGLRIMFNQHVFDIRQLVRQVISHPPTLQVGPFNRAVVTFKFHSVNIALRRSGTDTYKPLDVGIITDVPGQQVSSMAQICIQSSSLLSGVTSLDIGSDKAFSELDGFKDLMDNPEWPVLFRPFIAVQTLHLFGKIQPYVVSSLRVGGHTRQSVTEVLLPELQHLYLYERYWRDELEEETIRQFVTARQHSDHPITVDRIPRKKDN